MKDITIPLPELPSRFDRPAQAIRLLIGSRAIRIALVDGFLLFMLAMAALLGEKASVVYPFIVLVPLVLLGSILLSETVALERDAGTIELALTARSSYYFESRVASVIALLILQGWLGMIVARLFVSRFPLPFALIQTATVTIFFGTIALFWMTRLRQGGSVLFATIASFLLLGYWTMSNPIATFGDPFTGIKREMVFAWLRPNLFFIFGSMILYAYARRRLRNPESLMAR